MIKVEKFVVNPLGENSYVLNDETGECVFIDPGFRTQREQSSVKEYIEQNKLSPVKIINTHCHFDHVWGVEFVRDEYNIPFYAHADDTFLIDNAVAQAAKWGFQVPPLKPIDSFLTDNTIIKFGNSEMQIIHVPGHAPGHVVFYSKADNFLIAGDVLFYGSIGRTDLPGGDHNALITNIKNKLFVLPDETIVYCGHGQETSIGFEKIHNPFVQ